jgi:putative hydrolase of the HAD superfamily
MGINRCLLFDWGGTLMQDWPEFSGPMVGWPRVEAIAHAAGVLAKLHESWILALATNAVNSNEEQIWAALRRVGLDCFLDKVYCYRKIGHKKPSPEFFSYVLNDLVFDPSNVFMVGDGFDSDVMGAVRCGIRAIWLNEQSDEERNTDMYRTIHDLRSLPRVLCMFESHDSTSL